MKPISLKTQRILMWIPYLNFANWFIWYHQRKALGMTGLDGAKPAFIASGLMFLVFLPTSILVQFFPDAVLIGWGGFWLAGFVMSRYLIRFQEKLGQ